VENTYHKRKTQQRTLLFYILGRRRANWRGYTHSHLGRLPNDDGCRAYPTTASIARSRAVSFLPDSFDCANVSRIAFTYNGHEAEQPILAQVSKAQRLSRGHSVIAILRTIDREYILSGCQALRDLPLSKFASRLAVCPTNLLDPGTCAGFEQSNTLNRLS
jgi:hypothetical protein